MEGGSLNPGTVSVINKVAEFIKKESSKKLEKEDEDEKEDIIDTSKNNKTNSPVQRQEFVWDNIIQWLVTAILSLTILNVSADFFRNYTVSCHVPTDRRDEAAYVNNYCYDSLPDSEYFTLYILAHGFAIIAPHFLWKTLFESYINSFFDLVKDLDQLRDRETGDYNPRNFDIISKVINHQAPYLYLGYIVKLAAQIFFTCASIGISGGVFRDFNDVFLCPKKLAKSPLAESPLGWHLNTTVPCVYPSIRFLAILRIGDILLLIAIFVILLYALYWAIAQCHPDEIGHVDIAKFCSESCLNLKDYTLRKFTKYFKPRTNSIRTNLDFLIMMLYRASTGKGNTLREMLVEKYIQEDQGKNSELLQLFLNQSDTTDTTMLFKRANFRATIKAIGQKGSPRYQIETKYRPQLGLADDMEKLPDDKDINRLVKKLEGKNQTDFINKLYERDPSLIKQDPSLPYCCYPKVYPSNNNNVKKIIKKWNKKGRTRKELRAIVEELDNGKEISESTIGEVVSEKEIRSFKNQVYCFLQLVQTHSQNVQRLLAMDISFDGLGCTFILEWGIDSVCSINFQSHFHNKKDPVQCDLLYNQITLIRLPLDFFSLAGTDQTKLGSYLDDVYFDCRTHPPRIDRRSGKGDNSDRYINFITVGPMKEDARRVTVNLLLERLHNSRDIADNCLLLAIRPLAIGERKVYKEYLPYRPPYNRFDEYFKDATPPTSPEPEAQPLSESRLRLPPISQGATPEESQHLLSSFRLPPINDDEEEEIETQNNNKKSLEDIFDDKSFCNVDTNKGIIAYCADVKCVFEMKLYKYKIKQSERTDI